MSGHFMSLSFLSAWHEIKFLFVKQLIIPIKTLFAKASTRAVNTVLDSFS
jgi:hypothetical protein